MKLRKILLIGAAGVIATACAAEQDHHDPPDDLPHVAAPDAHGCGSNASEPQHDTQRPPQIVHERACGAFIAIDKLADDATTPKPDPGKPTPQPNGSTLIGLASALQTMDRLSKVLTSSTGLSRWIPTLPRRT
jgi:hypothetical protein